MVRLRYILDQGKVSKIEYSSLTASQVNIVRILVMAGQTTRSTLLNEEVYKGNIAFVTIFFTKNRGIQMSLLKI